MNTLTGDEAQLFFEDNFRKFQRNYASISGEKKIVFHKESKTHKDPNELAVATFIFSGDKGLLFDNPFQRYKVKSVTYDPKAIEAPKEAAA